jgi:hypothetical protein
MLSVSLDCFCLVFLEKQNKNNPGKPTTWGTQDGEKQTKNNLEKLTTYGTQGGETLYKNNPKKLTT